jgi:hypothetical protein
MMRQSNWRRNLLTLKSKTSVRDLPLPPVLVAMLKDYRRRWRHDCVRITVREWKRKPITSCYWRRDILHPIRERLGIPQGHSMRFGMFWALH